MLKCGLIAFLLATVFVRALMSRALSRHALDIPNDRSLHRVPVPRSGGVGLFAAAALAWLLFADGAYAALAAVTLLTAGVFLIDDLNPLSVRIRLLAQALTAGAFLAVYGLQPVWLLPFALLGLMWMMNLYNFMDGSDGLAGGMAVFGFGAYAVAAGLAGADGLAKCAAIVAGAAAGFLVWNLPPARIFLGDAGSIPLGFLAGCFGLIGWQDGVWPWWFPVLVFSPFVADATVTLGQRALRRERLAVAHKTHYYQRFHQMGFGHRGTALLAYALMAAAAGSALLWRTAGWAATSVMLAAWMALYIGLAVAIDRRSAAITRRSGQRVR
ncbi:MAG: MraY family glycosyltransferase [Hyphomicrobiaceae bacterium]